jgi:hypothetical protein
MGRRIEVTIKYSYELRPDTGPKVDDEECSEFCKLLVQRNRLYSRSDIEKLSEMLGYDVWTHCGGCYTNPETGITTDYCRHEWKSQTVVKVIDD